MNTSNNMLAYPQRVHSYHHHETDHHKYEAQSQHQRSAVIDAFEQYNEAVRIKNIIDEKNSDLR
ncbi:hypothetical protein AFI02nite_22530 [Aliivibrio fischeri]|uniref:Uncharacterized protein n=1 Tax=Aliivibrio fischeri TaxID=668 RepID=A0A510UI41_ALIFS|nr:hypothetical protein AFI02nite_22530 [Aliivibrio fischeri]